MRQVYPPEKNTSAWAANPALAALVLSQISDGVALFDGTGVVLGWNAGLERITGLSEAAVLGRELAEIQFSLAPEELRTPERLEQIRRIVAIYASEPQVLETLQEIENVICRPDGTLRTVSSRIFPIQVGEQGYTCALLRDVTEIRAAEERSLADQERDRQVLESQVAERTTELRALNATLHQDIVLREKIAEALRDAEQRFRQLVDNLPGVVFRCKYDVDWTFEFISEGILDICGYPAEEFIGENARSVKELVYPEDLPRVSALTREGIEKQGRYVLEYRIRSRDGSLRWVIERGQPVYSADGEVVALNGVFFDRTDMRAAEERLRFSEEKFARAFTHSPIPLTITTVEDGRFIEVNQSFVRLSGFSREALIGSTGVELDLWANAELRDTVHQAFGLQGFVDNIEIAMKARSGEIRYVVASLQPITVENTQCAVATYHDVTEERRILEALRASETRYRRLFEFSPISLWEEDFTEIKRRLDDLSRAGVLDFDAYFVEHPETVAELVDKLRVVDINQAALDLYRAGSKESLVRHLKHLMNANSYLGFRKELALIATQPNPAYNGVVRNNRMDDTEMDLLVSWSIPGTDPLDLAHVIVAVKDITNLKDAERRANTSLLEKETLLREIHHRVKNNLQIVSSLLGLQSEYILDPQAKAYFRDSQNRIRSMALVHEELYRTQNLARIPMRPYFENLVTSLVDAYKANTPVEFELQASEISLPIDSAIPLGLIVNELVTNSLKYAFPDSQPGKIRVELRAESDRTLVRVADDGSGLPVDLDFTQSPSLGLHLVNILVKQLHGTIVLERWAGVSFLMTFPMVGSPEEL